LLLLGTLERGGSETKFVRLAGRLSAKGRNVHLSWLGGSEALLDELSPSVVRHPLERRGSLSPMALMRLNRVIRDIRPSSLVCVNFYPMIYGWASGVFRPSLKVIASINTTDLKGPRERRFMNLYAPLLRRMNQVVFGSTVQQSQWVRDFRLRPERCSVIYNGVDSERYHPADAEYRRAMRSSHGIPEDAVVLTSVAQLRPEKGHDVLVEAFSRIPVELNTYLLLVGDGARKGELESMIAAKGIAERVMLAGEQADVRPWLAMSDAFVLASTAVETFSNAALEAAASGLPLVMSDIGGARELVGADAHEWLTPPASVEALRERLVRIASDQEARAHLGAQARARVLGRFTTGQMDAAWGSVLWPEEHDEDLVA
jgi:glycosyltransferase involved in cell wall biosynthesis